MFIRRNNVRKIVGCAEEKQDSWGDEWLPDSNPELQAFLSQSSSSANWRGFTQAMMYDPGYRRIAGHIMAIGGADGKLNLIWLTGAITYEVPTVAVIKQIWNDTIAVQLPLAQRPTTAEIAEWNRLAVLYSVPLTFGTGGVIA